MTITFDDSHTTVLKLLARGRSPEWVAEATSRKVLDVKTIGGKYGWPDVAKLQAALDGAGVADTAPRHQPGPIPRPVHPTPGTVTQLPGGATTNPGAATMAAPAGKLELLLARSSKHDTAPIRAARNSLLTACTRLEGALQKAETKQREKQLRDAEKAAAKSRVQLLEQQLREAKAALKGARPAPAKPAATAPERSGEDPKVVRAWARQHGVDCPDRGRVPVSVVEQFRAAATTPRGATA